MVRFIAVNVNYATMLSVLNSRSWNEWEVKGRMYKYPIFLTCPNTSQKSFNHSDQLIINEIELKKCFIKASWITSSLNHFWRILSHLINWFPVYLKDWRIFKFNDTDRGQMKHHSRLKQIVYSFNSSATFIFSSSSFVSRNYLKILNNIELTLFY